MYDVAIIGAGPAGLFTAYELITNNKNLKVIISGRYNALYLLCVEENPFLF